MIHQTQCNRLVPVIIASVTALNSALSVAAATPPATAKPAAKAAAPAKKSEPWLADLKSGNDAMAAKNFPKAEQLFAKALTLAETAKDNKAIVEILTHLANSMRKQEKYAEEDPIRRRAMSVAKTAYGESSAQTSEQIANLASTLALKGEVGEAHTFADQAIEMADKTAEDHPLALATAYLALGRVQVAALTPGLADENFRRALELRRAKLGDKSEEVTEIVDEYAAMLEKLDRKDEANKIKEISATARAAAAVTTASAAPAAGVKPNTTAFDTHAKAARAAADSGDRIAAIANWKLAVQDAEKLGAKDPRWPYALVQLSDQYQYQKQPADAKPLLKKALELREQAGATNTLGMARNLVRLGQMAMMEKEYGDSERYLTRAVDIQDKCGAADMMQSTLQSLISVYMMTKNFGKGEETCRKLMKVADSVPTANSAMKKKMATAMLGSIYMQAGRMQEGLNLMKDMGSGMQQGSPEDMAKSMQNDFKEQEKKADDSELASFK
jgi:hypothetical protein